MNPETSRPKPRVKPVDRRQLKMKVLDIEALVPLSHPARSLWEFVGRLNLDRFHESIRTVDGTAGRDAWDPRLLITLWIYAYSRGINSGREISRLCGYDPAFVWITADQKVNHHTLSDFRTAHGEALHELFVEVLGVMSAQGLIPLKRVMQDGTKVEAYASDNSFRREETLRKHLKMAEEQVQRMEELAAKEETGKAAGKKAARQEVCARERQARLEQALVELETVRAAKETEKEKAEARASSSDPQARVMKKSDGGYGPAYNMQIATDAENKIIVGVAVCQSYNDYHELEGMLEQVEQNTGKRPQEMVVDGGYVSTPNLVHLSRQGVEAYAPLPENGSTAARQPQGFYKDLLEEGMEFTAADFTYDEAAKRYVCPAGKRLHSDGKFGKGMQVYTRYRANWEDCRDCPLKSRCCPRNQKRGRSMSRKETVAEVVALAERMRTEEGKAIYQQRSEVAEFPNLWLKQKLGLRKFRLRGLVKVGLEALWAGLTYNLQQFIRLTRGRSQPVRTGS